MESLDSSTVEEALARRRRSMQLSGSIQLLDIESFIGASWCFYDLAWVVVEGFEE